MDMERTIQFILESQARAEVRMEKAEIRMEKAEGRMNTMDRRMDGIAKLLQQGMRMLVKTDTKLAAIAEAQKRTDVKLAELAEAQKRTEAKFGELAVAQRATERSLKAFIDSLRHGRNGGR